MSDQQLELSLPYEDFTGKVAGTTFTRSKFKRAANIFAIPFKDILLWDGYNTRTVFENIPELAQDIHERDLETPFGLVVLLDGRAFLKKGHRRYKAHELLISEGKFKPEDDVQFTISAKYETMEEMAADVFLSNNFSEKLAPIDQAETARRLKFCFGPEKSNEEVAVVMKVSRQTVDNLITVGTGPDDIKNQVRTGQMKFSDAVAHLKNLKKEQKKAEKKEEEAGQSSMYTQQDPKDSLKDEMAELKATEQQAQLYRDREAHRKYLDEERLKVIANLVPVSQAALSEQEGKQLAANAVKSWSEDFIDEDTGNVVTIDRNQVILAQGEVINQETIDLLISQNVEQVHIFKEIIPVDSVITEPVAQAEKSIYDLSRPEMEAMQKLIQGIDKIEAIVTRLDVPDGVKSDIAYQVHWAQVNASTAREWIHKNKKQNKRDR